MKGIGNGTRCFVPGTFVSNSPGYIISQTSLISSGWVLWLILIWPWIFRINWLIRYTWVSWVNWLNAVLQVNVEGLGIVINIIKVWLVASWIKAI